MYLLFACSVPFSPTMVEDQGQCNALIEHLLDNLIHLLPNMYPHASTSNTAVSLFIVYVSNYGCVFVLIGLMNWIRILVNCLSLPFHFYFVCMFERVKMLKNVFVCLKRKGTGLMKSVSPSCHSQRSSTYDDTHVQTCAVSKRLLIKCMHRSHTPPNMHT